MKRSGWGKAKLEITASWKDISNLLAQGQNLEEVYSSLSDQKIITVGKSTFKRHVKKLREQNECQPQSTITPQSRKPASAKKSVAPVQPKNIVSGATGSSPLGRSNFVSGMKPDEKIDFFAPAEANENPPLPSSPDKQDDSE